MAISKALSIAVAFLQCNLGIYRELHIKSDSSIAISWVNSLHTIPLKLNDQANTISNILSILRVSHIHLLFTLIPRSANSMADFLAKSGAHRPTALVAWLWQKRWTTSKITFLPWFQNLVIHPPITGCFLNQRLPSYLLSSYWLMSMPFSVFDLFFDLEGFLLSQNWICIIANARVRP